MQKIFLPFLLMTAFVIKSNAQQRLFDQPVQLKSCNISIEANPFIATTVVEMEFYNSRDQEVEAFQAFELRRGQVITDFQLELHGKYREGSIEERWKARQAYNTIVGKRIDPAILQMNGQNRYSINIYPVAAKSSRKIKFTITQLMVEENLKLSYFLPLNFQTVTEKFSLQVNVHKPVSIPYLNEGLLGGHLFSMNNDAASLSYQASNIMLNKPVSFSISQFVNKPQYCISKKNGATNFIMRFFPDTERFYPAKAKAINVYWDVSLSGKERNLANELEFLEKYIETNEINKATIFLFNHKLQGVIIFNRAIDNFTSIRNYLLAYKYNGATELGNLNFSSVLTDAVLLFTDGINSIGNAQPVLGAVPVHVVTSTYRYNNNDLKYLIGNTGGSVVSLYYTAVKDAVKRIDSSENFLFKYTANNMRIDETFPIKLGGSVLLSGTMNQSDNLELFYGNNRAVVKSENYFLPDNADCDEQSYKKMKMLKAYDSLMYGYSHYHSWQDMIVFGLTERVVTYQTSFLVLERIEDYIKYNIAPPKELEQQCAELNYVYRSEYKIRALREFTEQEGLESVVKSYNKRINWWGKDELPINLNAPVASQKTNEITPDQATAKNQQSPATNEVMSDYRSVRSELKEVVVTSAFGIKRTARSTSSNVQNLTYDQVNTVRQVNVNNALAGKVAGAQVRSQSMAKLGAETTLRLRGENGFGIGSGALYVVDGTIMPSGADINPDDIEDYSILQGPSAAALFGPDGSNGAVVMTTKRAKKGYPRISYVWSEYKLSSAADEDYLAEMKNAAKYEFWEVYNRLEAEHSMDIGFYFEMANFFFEKGFPEKANELMYNAIELCRGNIDGLKLAAYMYEQWKYFDKAIAVYNGILSRDADNLLVKRDLALAYFQNKRPGLAVKTYYSILTAPAPDYSNIKENAMAEMNAIIAVHKNEFDISYINHNLIRLLPVDLRITVENNYTQYNGYSQFIEPGKEICSYRKPQTANGGRYTGNNYAGYHYSLGEYSIKNATAGKYRVKVDAYNNYSYPGQVPPFVRVVTFKHFQKENMQIEIKLFDLDNQYGVVELDEVMW